MSEELKKLLGDDLHKQVTEKLGEGKKIDIIQDGEKSLFIPKGRFDEVNTKLKEATTEVETVRTKAAEEMQGVKDELKKLKESGGDAAGMKEQITAMEGTIAENEKKATEALKEARVTSAIRESLILEGAGETYLDYLTGQVNRDSLAVSEDGKTVTGVKEQVPEMKKAQAAMFNGAKPPASGTGHQPPGHTDTDTPPEGILTKAQIKAMDGDDVAVNREQVNKSMAYWAKQKT